MLLLLLLLSMFVVVMFWWQRKYWRAIWQLNGYRGVLMQPVLWILLLLFMEPSSILDVTRRVRRYLPRPLAIYVIWWHCLLLYVDDPHTMEAVLTAPECLDKTFLQEGFFARNGLLHARGQKWRIRRKQLNPAFSHKILLNFFGTFNMVGDQLCARLNTCRCDGDGMWLGFKDLEDLLSRAVLEVSCQTTMGTSMNFLSDDPQNVARTYKTLMDISALKIIRPWLQIDWLFALLEPKRYRQQIECNKLVEQFVGNIVEGKHREWLATKIAGNTSTATGVANEPSSSTVEDLTAEDFEQRKRIFIEQIFHLAECGELTLQDIMDETHSMILVSFETVSNTILIALLNLAMHPDCQRNIRAELNAHLASSWEEVRAADLQQLKYLDMALHESLRLLTTVPMNLRHVSKEFELKVNAEQLRQSSHHDIVIIPTGSLIVLDTFNMQRDPINWGAHAETFYPEHFSHTSSSIAENTGDATTPPPTNGRHPYAFVPFSKGLRTCIGQRYSIYLTKIILIKLLSSYEFHTTTKLQDLQFVEGISLKFRNAERIQFQLRKFNK